MLRTQLKTVLLVFLFFLVLPRLTLAQGTQSQTISFLPIADRPVNSAPFQVVAVSSAYLPVSLSVQGPATLNGRLLTLTGIGAVTVTATQAGNTDYAPTEASLSFQSLAITPAVTWSPASVPYGTPLSASLLNATATASPVLSAAADVATVTSQLDSSALNPGAAVLYPASSPIFRYEGATVEPSTAPNDNAGYVTNSVPAPYALNFNVAFTCDCQQFEFAMQSRQGNYRIWVDGAYTSPDATALSNTYPQAEYVLVTFPDKRIRQVKITDEANAPFYGVNTAGSDTISVPQVPLGQQVMIFGDSWVAPTILPPVLPPAQPGVNGSGFPQILGQFFNWNYWDDGIGGTGFTNTGTDSLGRTFVQRIETDVCPYKFSAIVLLGGVNDENSDESTMQSAVTDALSELHTCEPGVPVYLYGPQAYDQPIDQAMSAAVSAAAAPVSYTDMGQDGWFYGSSTDPSTGNDYLYLNGHPTPLGHDFLAEEIATDLIGKFPNLLPQPYVLSADASVAGTFSYNPGTGTVLPAGNNPVSIDFTPADSTNYLPTSYSGTLVVTKATTSINLTDTQQNGTVTLNVSVAPQISGTPSGTVTFLDHGTSIGTAQLSGGAASASFDTAALPAGDHSITASYGGDDDFQPSTTQASLTIVNTAPDFSFALSAAEVTVVPGATANLQLTITPAGGLTGPLSVQCLGLPQNATCSLSSLQLTPSQTPQTATLTIQAYTPTASLQPSDLWRHYGGRGGAATFCCLAVVVPFRRKRRTLLRCALVLGVIGIGIAGGGMLTGCGSTSKIAYAAPGTYTVQVVLTSSGAGHHP